jgi:hypothetical protein
MCSWIRVFEHAENVWAGKWSNEKNFGGGSSLVHQEEGGGLNIRKGRVR